MRNKPDFEKVLEKQLGGDTARPPNCLKYDENFLAAYMEEQLAAAKLGEFEQHLIHCPCCRREVAMLSALFETLGGQEEESMRIAAEAAVQPAPESFFGRLFGGGSARLRWAVASIAFAVILGSPLYFLMNRQHETTRSLAIQKAEPAAQVKRDSFTANDRAAAKPADADSDLNFSLPTRSATQPALRRNEAHSGDSGRKLEAASPVNAVTVNGPIDWEVGVRLGMDLFADKISAADGGSIPASSSTAAAAPPPKPAMKKKSVPGLRPLAQPELRDATLSNSESSFDAELSHYEASVREALLRNLRSRIPAAPPAAPAVVEITVAKDGRISRARSITSTNGSLKGSEEQVRKDQPRAAQDSLSILAETKFPAFPKALADKRQQLTFVVSISVKR